MSAKPILIVESPSKAKTISKYLGGKYEVMACVGHIKDLPKTDLGVDVDNDFAINEEVLDDKKPFMKELQKLAKQTDQIVVATDPDREGEAIAAHIASEVDPEKISRVLSTEITKEGIEEGMNEIHAIDTNLVEARTARRIIDRLVGYKVSRVLWSTLKKNMKFVQVSLSAGRVQSAALKIIIERERLRQAFHSALYYDLKAELQAKDDAFDATLIRVDGKRIATGKDFDPNTGNLKNDKVLLLSKAQADELVKELNKGDFTVLDIEEKIKNNKKINLEINGESYWIERTGELKSRKNRKTKERTYFCPVDVKFYMEDGDDILDLTSDSQTLGKPAGNDILEGTYTLPVHIAMQKNQSLIVEKLQEVKEDNTKIENLLEILRSDEILSETREIANQHSVESQKSLETLRDSSIYEVLIKINTYLIQRTY